MDKNYILTAGEAKAKLVRMAFEIVENNPQSKRLIIAGIKDNGLVIAEQLKAELAKITDQELVLISLQLYKPNPTEVLITPMVPFDGETIIVVDDVANSGKTMLYALKPFLDFHPSSIQLVALVARTHKTFPVQPDYVGLSVATTLQDHIYVEIEEGVIKGAYLD